MDLCPNHYQTRTGCSGLEEKLESPLRYQDRSNAEGRNQVSLRSEQITCARALVFFLFFFFPLHLFLVSLLVSP